MTDDGRLLEQWKRQGSQAAFSALVTRHLDFVYSVCLRETQDAALAEDTTQVVFLLLSRKAPAFGPDTRLTGWLFQTARFACKNARRRDASRRRHEQKIGEQMLSESLGQDALWEQMAPHLNAALASLGTKDREAVLLRFADGLSFAELGTALGTSEDAARMRVTRALTRLRGFFAKQGVSIAALVLTGLLADRTTQAAPASCVTSLGKLGASAPSPQVSMQFQGAIKTMTLIKLKLAATVGAGAMLVGAIPFVTLAQAQKPALPTPPSIAPRPVKDQTGLAVIEQAARATAALHSLSADTQNGDSIKLQRPAQYVSESPGTNGQTTIVNGSDEWVYLHWNKKYQRELNPDLKPGTNGIPVFSNFFFNPGLQGLVGYGLKPSATSEVHLLGKKQLRGETYTAVQITYPPAPAIPIKPQNGLISGTMTVYIGADHLLHAYSVDILYHGQKTYTGYALKNLRINPKFADNEFVWTPPAGASPYDPPVGGSLHP